MKKLTDKQIKFVFDAHQSFTGDWVEFGELMNSLLGLELDESAYRKPIQSFEKISKIIASEGAEDNLKRIYAIKELKINKKNKDLKVLTTELNKVKNELYSGDVLVEMLTKAVIPLKSVKEINTTEIDAGLTKNYKPKKENVFIISDVQEDGSGFSHDVLKIVGDKMIETIKKEKLKEIYILENGDGIDGVLRVSSLYENHGGYVKQLQYYWQALADLLHRISKYAKVKFSIVNSNHTEIRPFGVQRGQIKDEDVTFLILGYLKAALRNNSNITFLQSPKRAQDLNHNILNIAGYTIYQHHGDNKGSNPNAAVNYFNKIIRYHNDINVDFVLVAHWHHMVYKTVNKLAKGGDSVVVYSPALDPRQDKSNEYDMMLSSEPAFLRLEITEGQGITLIQKIQTNYYL